MTGLGAISSLGQGVDAIVRAMIEGRDGLSEMTRFDITGLHPVRFAGWLREPWERREPASLERWVRAAVREAWNDSGLAEVSIAPERIAVVSGTTLGEEGALSRSADDAAAEVGARGPRWTISTACASSANAIGFGRDLIEWGDADVVIVGGVEKLVVEIMAGFAVLGVLGADKCAPFGEQIGTTLGEGAGYLVLERGDLRANRRRSPAYVLGYALSGDAWHETSPDPRGAGLARAISACLVDASVEPEAVDYVNAHATGTAANDDAEWRGIRKALGARATSIPVSASKGFLGHAQGAAGVLETIATIACMQSNKIPPSARVGRGRPSGPSDPVGETGRARDGSIDVALSNSMAFGGSNAVVAIARAARSARPLTVRAVSIEGLSIMRTAAGCPRDARSLAAAVGDTDLRAPDPSTLYAIASARAALAQAGLRLSAASKDRTGLFGGCVGPPRASVEEFRESLKRGLDRASAPAFARTVAHAPLGAVSRALGARGPLSMVVGDAVAGLLALAYAARWLAVRSDADQIIAGGFDERAIDSMDDEGAAFAVLCTEGSGPLVRGVATAGTLRDAVDRALSSASFERRSVDLTLGTGSDSTRAYAFGSVLEAALDALSSKARRALVTAEGPQGSVAVVLEAR
ncbi:MAG: beta-ketoacyl-[acyl-carrier-protein] synthase family protein [Polyangiales bacterium]